MKLRKQLVNRNAYCDIFKKGIKVQDKDIHIISSGDLMQVYERRRISFSQLFSKNSLLYQHDYLL